MRFGKPCDSTKIASIEKVTYDSQMSATEQVLKDHVFRCQSLMEQTCVDILKSLDKPPSASVAAMKADFDALKLAATSKFEPAMAAVANDKATWVSDLNGNEGDAAKIIELQGKLSKASKEWNANNEKFKEYKAAVTSLIQYKKTSAAAVEKS